MHFHIMVTNQILRNEGRQMETFEIRQQSKICFQYFVCMYYLFPSQNKHECNGDVLQSLIKRAKKIYRCMTLSLRTLHSFQIQHKKKSIKAPEQHLIGHTTKYDVLAHMLQSNNTEMHLKTVFPLLWPQKQSILLFPDVC